MNPNTFTAFIQRVRVNLEARKFQEPLDQLSYCQACSIEIMSHEELVQARSTLAKSEDIIDGTFLLGNPAEVLNNLAKQQLKSLDYFLQGF